MCAVRTGLHGGQAIAELPLGGSASRGETCLALAALSGVSKSWPAYAVVMCHSESKKQLPQSVSQVVQLSTLPRELWVGLPVFHPQEQQGSLADWESFDVGVVIDVEPDADFPDEYRCQFVAGFIGETSTLRYAPWNLWVPADLAARIVR